MAAVTVDSVKSEVWGSSRVKVAQVDIASDADTWDTGLLSIKAFTAVGSGGNVIDGTVSGGTITFNTVGAENNVLVTAIGY